MGGRCTAEAEVLDIRERLENILVAGWIAEDRNQTSLVFLLAEPLVFTKSRVIMHLKRNLKSLGLGLSFPFTDVTAAICSCAPLFPLDLVTSILC